ncbi:MAG: gephyrin-like molybdotransferase Glp [Aestuariivirga sp.]
MALLPVSEALARILDTARLTSVESVSLGDALGRILAKDIVARRDQPPFDASAMDGYAVQYEDTTALPASLKLIGMSAAGHAFKGQVKAGTAVRILTGAPVPRGADTVVIQENTRIENQFVVVLEATRLGRNIRASGLDFGKGALLVAAGLKLGARDIGLAASADAALIRARKKPMVAIFSTGDELVEAGSPARADQITSSNAPALAAFVRACGGDVIDLGIIRDNLGATTTAIKKAARADILVTTGGASVGDHDHVQAALKKAGVKIDFWKIAMRPGKPFMFGTKGNLRVLGLPGNPVAALVCAQIFLKPLIDAMLGVEIDVRPVLARLGCDLPANDQRQDYLRAKLELAADGARTVAPHHKQDSSMQRVMRDADCLVIRPPFAPEVKVGDIVEVLLFPEGA